MPSSTHFLKRYRTHSLIGGGIFAVLVIVLIWFGLSRPASAQFALRQNVTQTSDLHFSFPELMNHASVEKELSKPADLQGTWTWDNDVLVLHPSAPLKAGATYAFHAPRSTQTAKGQALGRDLDFIFTVAGPPKLSVRLPIPDTVEVDRYTKITLVFDRAMIPLTQVQGAAADQLLKEWPVTITPELPGRWRWMSTVAIEFIPSKPLTANTRYTVHVPAGIGTVIGDKTEKDESWSFQTVRPSVTSTSPVEGSLYEGPNTKISVTFNEDIDRTSAQEHISLYEVDGSGSGVKSGLVQNGYQVKGKKIDLQGWKYGTMVDEDNKMVTDKTTIIATPKTNLSFKHSYQLFVAAGVQGTEGDIGTESGSLVSFATVGDPEVVSGKYEYGSVHVVFTNPVETGSLLKGMVIDPPVVLEKTEEGETKDFWVADPYSATNVNTYSYLKPSTKYTVTINTQVKDRFGQHLKKPYTFSFTTDPVPSKVFIESKGEFGIFEKDKPPVYYINDVNVSAVTVNLVKLTLPQFLAMHQDAGNQYGGMAPTNPETGLESVEGVQTFTLKPKAKQDTWEAIPFDVAERQEKKPDAGIYAMDVSAPEYKNSFTQKRILDRQYFSMTNMSVTLKYSGDHTLVWVTDMQTGDPVNDAIISFVALDGKTHLTGKTGADGFFESALALKDFETVANTGYPTFYVTAEKGDDFAFIASSWNQGIQSNMFDYYTDFRTTDSGKYRVDSFTYTERPLYKAGDTVFFKGIIRFRDWNGVSTIPGKDRTVSVTVSDPNGNQIAKIYLPFSEYGSFNGSFPLDKAASLGYYSVNVRILPDTELSSNYVSTGFQVLAYRKPEYFVEMTPAKLEYFNHDTVESDVSGSYYFGAAMAGAKVQWRAYLTDYYFNKYDYRDGWYSFNDDNTCYDHCEEQSNAVMDGQGKLDATGHLQIHVPVSIDAKKTSQVLSIEADLTDQNNQVVSNRTEVTIHKSSVYVGIRSDDYVVTPGTNATMSLLTLQPDGTAQPGQTVTVDLYARVWNTIRKKGIDGDYYYDNQPKDTFISSANVTTDQAGKGTVAVMIPKGGEYHVIAKSADASGRTAVTGTSVYAWSSSYVNWPHANNDRLEIVTDKPTYKVGDTAKLLVKSPFQGKGVKALVTVERENIITKKVIDVNSNALPIEIPIDSKLIPNAYVSVLIIKNRMGETFDENGLDTGAPAFRMGYTRLSVDTSSKNVDVSVTTDKPTYTPGETVTVHLKTLDANGKPVSAEVSVGTVDMSLLALSGYWTPDLVSTFYTERGLGVSTAQLLTYLVDRYKPGSKGGGGGEDKKRGVFKDTAYWNPSIITDTNGLATVSFKLPDNLTTWQILAIAQTKQHTFGSVAKTFIETKHVIVRPVRPRFAVVGDTMTLGAIVHNFLDGTHTFTVSLSGSGFTAKAGLTQQITLKGGEQTKILFPIQINPTDNVTFNFKAVSGPDHDEIEESIPVYSFGILQSVATTGIVENTSAQEAVHVPSVADASEGTLSLTVSPSLATYLPKGLSYLMEYPYGCTEQILSSFLPSVAVTQLQGFDAFHIADQKKLNDIVTTGFQKLYSLQRPDGGFGYWQESTSSFPYLSAYVLYGMHLSEKSGFAVDAGAMKRTQDYLENILHSKKPENQLDLATRAYILYVLSETGKPDQSLLNNIYDERAKLPLFAQAQLAMSFENAKNTSKAQSILNDILNHAKVDARGTHFEEENGNIYGSLMNTNDRTTATILQAMIRIDDTNALIPAIIRSMLSVRTDGHWDTTQSTVQSLITLVEFLQNTQELDAKYTAHVQVNGAEKLTWQVDEKNIVERKDLAINIQNLLRDNNNTVTIAKEGKGRLYYDLLLSYFYTPGNTIDPIEEGMSIVRDMQPLAGQKKDPTVGNTYQVTLTMTVPEDRNFVAVTSPLPAGMEIVDTQLQTSQQHLLEGSANDLWSDAYWKSGAWIFSHYEFRDDELFLSTDSLPAGVYQYRYLVRATTPGHFHERPAKIWEMYFPEVFGQSKGGWFDVKDSE